VKRSRASTIFNRCGRFIMGLALILCVGPPAQSAPLAVEDVPPALEPWVAWAIHGHEKRTCPFLHGGLHGGDAQKSVVCAWPSRLELDLDDSGGRFTQHWQIYAEARVALPGSAREWPLDVRSAQGLLAIEDTGAPRVSLAAGEHVVSGRFEWGSLPELLQIPPQTGIVSLSIRGRVIANPRRDAQGRLWLQKRASPSGGEQSQVQVVVHRRVIDEIPLRLRTRVALRVSGVSREVVLGHALPGGFVPMSLQSPLPARVDPDGRLRVQVRPGDWVLHLDARHEGVATELAAPLQESAGADDGAWDADEVWVFDARPHLRRVEVQGGALLDPSRTTLPADWQRFPAYLMKPGQPIRLVEQRRGDSDPSPDTLELSREFWLDFDGGGYTVRDIIHGSIRRGSRLEVDSRLDLGRVSLNGQDQVITQLEGSEARGIEIPRGKIRVSADSRIERDGHFSAVGWGHDFEALSSTLHLPPGWRLFHASGVDRATSTWLNRWTLLDLFFVFVIAMAVFRLHGPLWGAFALLTLGLSYTEPRAPQMLWIAVLVGEALARAGSALGRFAPLVSAYRWAAMIVLVLFAISFGVREIRVGLYPALAKHGGSIGFEAGGRHEEDAEAVVASADRRRPEALGYAEELSEAKVSRFASSAPSVVSQSYDLAARKRYAPDPTAAVTTGPGLPTWGWDRVAFAWSGPVDRAQSLRLALIPPWLNTVLAFVRVALLAALVIRLLFSAVSVAGAQWNKIATHAIYVPLVALLSVVAFTSVPPTARADLPAPELIEELRERLLASAACRPHCASISRLRIQAADERLDLRLQVDIAARSAIPLPGASRSWMPDTVTVDGERAGKLYRSSDGTLWLVLDPGRHQVLARGGLVDRDEIDLPLALRPHAVETSLRGWSLHGLHDDGQVEANLRLSRVRDMATESQRALDPGEMPTFLKVERVLELGLEWRLVTRVERMTPAERAVVLEIPLLPGEAVTTERVRVEGGSALVSMAPGETQLSWKSTLAERSELVLIAPTETPWTEVWRLDVSPIWHLDVSGIPSIHEATSAGARTREWRPWPGEEVRLSISRPGAVAGPTLTIDANKLLLRPGLRATDAELKLRIRSSRGAQHPITLPEGATLQNVEMDGVVVPIRQEGRIVTLPLHPGSQVVVLRWQEPRGIAGTGIYRSSHVDLGSASVNAEVEISPSVGRWILLTGGPRLGPAVLFWSLLIVLLGVAYGLGFVRTTPLRPWHWFLLGIGLTQVALPAAAVVVGWLFALGWRRTRGGTLPNRAFDAVQVGLVLLTVVALALLLSSIEQGLLGNPKMQIAGNGSSASSLIWYQDRIAESPPDAWVLSVPILVYRIMMLGWALWIAQALVGWLRWGWACFNEGGTWRAFSARVEPEAKGEGD